MEKNSSSMVKVKVKTRTKIAEKVAVNVMNTARWSLAETMSKRRTLRMSSIRNTAASLITLRMIYKFLVKKSKAYLSISL